MIGKYKYWLGFSIIIIILPFFMDKFIIGNNIPSNISNSDWVSFLASYMGAIASVIGIIMTIEHTKKEAREDRRLSLAPLLSYEAIQMRHDSRGMNLFKPNFIDKEIIRSEDKWDQNPAIKIENIGLGPLLNLTITDIKLEERQLGENIFEDIHMDETQKVLKKDGILFIQASFSLKAYSLEELDKKKQQPENKEIKISFTVRYDDAINTHYAEEVTLMYNILFLDQTDNSTWSNERSFSVLNVDKKQVKKNALSK